MISVTNEQVERVSLILGSIKNGKEKALVNSINRGLTTVRSQSGKLIRNSYRIKQSDITSNSNMNFKKASFSNLEGSINFAGAVIPLTKFKVTPTNPSKRQVTVAVLRETGGERIKHAFVAKMKSGHVGVLERVTKKRLPLEELYGPSSVHMMSNLRVLEQVEEKAQDIVNKRIEHEISRILNQF